MINVFPIKTMDLVSDPGFLNAMILSIRMSRSLRIKKILNMI